MAKSAPSTSTPSPLLLEEVTSLDGDLEFGDAPSAPPVGCKVHILKACKTLVQMLSKAVETERAPSSYDILTWMDAENSEVDGLYIDSYGDFQTFEVKDALSIMENRVGVLASFGYLGRGGALLRYCRNVRPTWVRFNSKDTKESEVVFEVLSTKSKKRT